jgi:hypothetical protein
MAHSIEARLDRSIAARTIEQATFMFDPPFRWFRGKQRRKAYQHNYQDAKRNEQDFDGTHEILMLYAEFRQRWPNGSFAADGL